MARFVHVAHVQQSLYAVKRVEQRHEAHELIYALTEGYRARIDGRIHGLEPGELLVLPAGTPHRSVVTADNRTAVYVLQWSGELPGDDGLVGPLYDARGRVLVLLRWLDELAEGTPPRDRARLARKLLSLVLEALGQLVSEGVPTFARRVLRGMEDCYRYPISLSDLADTFGITAAHLGRRFKAETGETPGQALIRMRVDHALSLLASTDLPLAEIAEQVGIGSAAHLGRLVKRATGRSAASLRRDGGT